MKCIQHGCSGGRAGHGLAFDKSFTWNFFFLFFFLNKRKREWGKTCQKEESECKRNIKLIQAWRLHEQLDFPIAGFPPAHERWWLSGTFHRPVQVFVSSCILIKSVILVTGEGDGKKGKA